MKSLKTALVVVACVSMVSARDVEITGTWDVAVQGQGERTRRFTMSVVRFGDLLAAAVIAPDGEWRRATIAVEGVEVTVRFELDDEVGSVPVVMTGTVDGDRIKGRVNFGGISSDWTATRRAAAGTGAALGPAPFPVPLSGSVRDIYTRDGMLSGATVVVTNNRTGSRQTLETGDDGQFAAGRVPPGTYTISISMPGYGGIVSRNFCVERGRPARFDVALGPDRGGASIGPDPGGAAPVAARPTGPRVLSPVPVASADAMSSAEIEQAMEFGRRSATLRAHPLNASGGKPRQAGSLFTPFWRVATMTQVAAATNQRFTVPEIPASVVQRMAWIVGFANEHVIRHAAGTPTAFAHVTDIAIRPKGKSTEADIHPAWRMYQTTTCDLEQLESVLGPQFTLPATVAAFPMDAIRAGNTIVFTYSKVAMPRGSFRGITVGSEVRQVKISERDVREWK